MTEAEPTQEDPTQAQQAPTVEVTHPDVATAMLERINIQQRIAHAQTAVKEKNPEITAEDLENWGKIVYQEVLAIVSYNINLDESRNIINDGQGLGQVPGGNALSHMLKEKGQEDGYIWSYTLAADVFHTLGLHQKTEGCLAIAGRKALQKDGYIETDSPTHNWRIH